MARENISHEVETNEPESGSHRVATSVGKLEITLTVAELCGAVGNRVKPESFLEDALEEIIDQVEASDRADTTLYLASIIARARFAVAVSRSIKAALQEGQDS